MADIQKKMAAALAAVTTYLQDEERLSAGGAPAVTPADENRFQMNLWAQSGRQEMMNMRRLIQMRAFDRCR